MYKMKLMESVLVINDTSVHTCDLWLVYCTN